VWTFRGPSWLKEPRLRERSFKEGGGDIKGFVARGAIRKTLKINQLKTVGGGVGSGKNHKRPNKKQWRKLLKRPNGFARGGGGWGGWGEGLKDGENRGGEKMFLLGSKWADVSKKKRAGRGGGSFYEGGRASEKALSKTRFEIL